MSQEYKRYIANKVRDNQYKYLQHTDQPEALSTTQYQLRGGKPLRSHPKPGYTQNSEDVGTLFVGGPTLMNRMYDGNIGDMEGAGVFGDIGRELKSGLSKGAKAVFHDVIVPVGTSMAKDYVKKKMTGTGRPRGRPPKHGAGFWGDVGHELKSGLSKGAKAVFHDVIVPVGTSMAKDYVKKKMTGTGRPRGRPRKHNIEGAGFWKDFGHGFVQGIKGTTKVASKVLPIATMLAPELAPLTGAVMATNKLINKGSGRGRPRGGNKVWDTIKKGAKVVGHYGAPIAKEIFHDVIVPAGTEMAKSYVKSKMGGRRCVGGASELYRPAVMRGGAKSGARSARGELIKKVMAKYKCNLGQASKYIKENNLH